MLMMLIANDSIDAIDSISFTIDSLDFTVILHFFNNVYTLTKEKRETKVCL